MGESLATILNVNDHEQTRYLITRILRGAGYEVLEAGSGEDALRMATSKPDLIVLDVKLPDISGFEVCRMLKRRAEYASIFILQTSATWVTADKKIEGLESGADSYLTHPFEPAELIATVRSLLRLRRAEQELRARAEQLVEADRRKDEFLAMLAHELRNPLAAIATGIPLVETHCYDDVKRRSIMQVLERQTKHLGRLIDDLLDVSRINRGKIELRHEPLDLAALATEAVESLAPVLATRGQNVNTSVPDAPVVVRGDRARLLQIACNLLDNASKYSDKEQDIEMGVRVEGNDAVLYVRDHGIGIEPRFLPRVFELFAQADESLERTRGGMGIGLTLVKRLVELHGGRVVARSDGLGEGSEFVVTFPIADATQPIPRVEPRAAASGESRVILLVEDNADAADMMKEFLEVAGHEVDVARDGLTGAQRAIDGRYDVAIVDIGLPGASGYDVASRIRSHSRSQRLPLIALTGYGGDEQSRRALQAGFDRHLVKPADPHGLLALIHDLCG